MNISRVRLFVLKEYLSDTQMGGNILTPSVVSCPLSFWEKKLRLSEPAVLSSECVDFLLAMGEFQTDTPSFPKSSQTEIQKEAKVLFSSSECKQLRRETE